MGNRRWPASVCVGLALISCPARAAPPTWPSAYEIWQDEFDGSGCGCHVVGSSRPGPGPCAVLILCLLAILARGRRRLPGCTLLVVVLLSCVHCGGGVGSDGSTEGTGPIVCEDEAGRCLLEEMCEVPHTIHPHASNCDEFEELYPENNYVCCMGYTCAEIGGATCRPSCLGSERRLTYPCPGGQECCMPPPP